MIIDRLLAHLTDDGTPTVLERKFQGLIDLSADERDCLKSLQSNGHTFQAKTDLVEEGDKQDAIMVALTGWGIRYRLLDDGRRQILNFVLPGDFIGLYASLAPLANCSVAAVTPMTASRIDPLALMEIFAKLPRLGALICWSAQDDEAILREQIVRLGRRTALERTAHMLLEVQRRVQRVIPEAAEDRVFFPISQEMLADTLGLSIVHINRVLRRLRQADLLRTGGHHFEILDWKGLARTAKFSDDYLQQDPVPAETQAVLG